MQVNRDPPAVVDHSYAIVDVDRNLDLVAESRQGLIDGVIHHLIDQMMQSSFRGVSDIHSGSLSDRFQTLEDFNIVGLIIGL